jgi:hypothetical protein
MLDRSSYSCSINRFVLDVKSRDSRSPGTEHYPIATKIYKNSVIPELLWITMPKVSIISFLHHGFSRQYIT